jgi:hypothetical protein
MRTFFFLVFIVIFPAVTYSQPSIVFDEKGFISSVVRVLSNAPATLVVTLFLEAMIEDTTDTPLITEK